MNDKQVKVKIADGKGKVRFCLRGTVLICYEKNWANETILEIPIELISITKEKKIYEDRLVYALFSFVFVPGLFYVIYCLLKLFVKNLPYSVTSSFITAGLISSVAVFLVQVVYLFIKQEKVTLTILPSERQITFWVPKKNKKNIEDLINEIESRKKLVEKTISYPMQTVLVDSFETPWKKAVLLTLFTALPGMIFRNPWLLIPAAIPLIYLLYNTFLNFRCSIHLRNAYKFYRLKHWDDAIKSINKMLEEEPEHLQSKLLLIELMLRKYNFSEADNLLADITAELDTKILQEIQQDIILRKRIHERHDL